MGIWVTINYDNRSVSALLIDENAAARWVGETLPSLMLHYGIGEATKISVYFSKG